MLPPWRKSNCIIKQVLNHAAGTAAVAADTDASRSSGVTQPDQHTLAASNETEGYSGTYLIEVRAKTKGRPAQMSTPGRSPNIVELTCAEAQSKAVAKKMPRSKEPAVAGANTAVEEMTRSNASAVAEATSAHKKRRCGSTAAAAATTHHRQNPLDSDRDPLERISDSLLQRQKAGIHNYLDSDGDRWTFHGDCHATSCECLGVDEGNVGFLLANFGANLYSDGAECDAVESRAFTDQHMFLMSIAAPILVVLNSTNTFHRYISSPPAGETSMGHWVVSGREPSTKDVEDLMLVACREDRCSGVERLFYYEFCRDLDEPQQERFGTRAKVCLSKLMVCRVTFTTSIGFIGSQLTFMVFEGDFLTMSNRWPERSARLWDMIAQLILKYDVRMLLGDFGRSLTNVPNVLRCRDIWACCFAWYPWLRATDNNEQHSLCFDSCGMFWIGTDDLLLRGCWHLPLMRTLLGTAAEIEQKAADEACRTIFRHRDSQPGEHWSMYVNEQGQSQELLAHLCNLLTPPQSHVVSEGGRKRLSFKQKSVQPTKWPGLGARRSHFPLLVFTANRHVSTEASRARESRIQFEKKMRKDRDGRTRRND